MSMMDEVCDRCGKNYLLPWRNCDCSTLPPEAVVYRLDDHLFRSLRCAILETELPRIVEMARGIGGSDGWTWHLGEPKEGWAHTPASILDQLTREG